MFYWYYLNLKCFLLAFFKPRQSFLDPIYQTHRVGILDTDWFNSMQASRFFFYTDAARWELGVRAGFLKPFLRNRWVAVVGGQKIINRKPLPFWRKFTLKVHVSGFDDRWFYVVQSFIHAGELKCLLITKLGMRGPAGLVNPHEICRSLGISEKRHPPEWITPFFADDLKLWERYASGF